MDKNWFIDGGADVARIFEAEHAGIQLKRMQAG
jgi:hypothetical protein